MGVYYNGIHSIEFLRLDGSSNEWKNTWDDFHLVPTSRPYIANPDPKYQIVQLPNMNDRIDITNRLPEGILYGMRTGEWEFLIDHEKWSSWSDCYRALVQYFHGFRFAVNLTDRENADEQKAYVGRLVIRSYSPGNDYSKIIIQYQLEKDLSNNYTVPHWEPLEPDPDLPTGLIYSKALYVASSAYENRQDIYGVSFPRASYIGSDAFYSCTNLSIGSFPVCKSIEERAFSGCINLNSIYIPTCTFISSYAFMLCSNLKTINCNSLTSLGENVFQDCIRLQNISLPNINYIGAGAFINCTSISSVIFPVCRTLSSYAFNGCSNLSSIGIDNCVSIGDAAFFNCQSLSYAFLPYCRSIGNSVFAYCYELSRVELQSLKNIERYTFSKCYYIKELCLSECESIATSAFADCTYHLTLYLFGSSVCDIGSYSNLTSNGLTIYVSQSLISSYLAIGDWQYHSEDIVAL